MRLGRAAKAIRKLGLHPHLYAVFAAHMHTPDVSSHMRNKWGLMLVRTSYGWRDLISLRTRSMDRCVALPSNLPTLSYLRHTISSKKGDVLDSSDYSCWYREMRGLAQPTTTLTSQHWYADCDKGANWCLASPWCHRGQLCTNMESSISSTQMDIRIRLHCTGALEVWPIPNISYTLKRIGVNLCTDWF